MCAAMEPEPFAGSVIQNLAGRAFVAALLLTGSAESAEAAVMQAIDAWDARAESQEALFQNAMEAAAAQNTNLPAAPEPDDAGWRLPAELLAVMELAPELRRSFVLRILLGLPSQICARLLQLNPQQMNLHISAALPFLPRGRAFASNQ